MLKGAAFQAILLYSLYELYDKRYRAQWANLTKLDREYELVHGWDEGWAFWSGSAEGGSGDGVFPYSLAEKRASSFDTDDAGNSSEAFFGSSRVNFRMLGAAQVGRNALMNYGSRAVDVSAVSAAYECLEQQAFVPPLQGCLLYTYKASVCEPDDEDCGAAFGEAYAFCEAILPILHGANSSAAEIVRFNVDPREATAVPLGYHTTRDAIYGNLNAMGIRCADVGACSECGDDAEVLCPSDDGVRDACGLAWPRVDGAVPSSDSSSGGSSKTKAGSDPWKFVSILFLAMIGSYFVALLLTHMSFLCGLKRSPKVNDNPKDEEAGGPNATTDDDEYCDSSDGTEGGGSDESKSSSGD